MKTEVRLLTALASAMALSGCNWFDDDSTDFAPTAEIEYPTRTGFTPAPTLKVRGTANDDSAVSSVSVNGVLATSSDSFATWTVDVPLSVGTNNLVVEVVDNAGQRVSDADAVVVERRDEIRRPFGFEYDADSDSMYYVDIESFKIMAVDMQTGAVEAFADLAQFEPTNGGLSKVSAADKSAGAISELAGSSQLESASSFARPPLDLALDLENNRVFLTVRDPNAVGDATIGIWKYDTNTEEWTAFSDDTIDPASVFSNPADVKMDTANNRLLAIDFDNDCVVAVNLSTGLQTVLSSNTVPDSNLALFAEPIDSALDTTNNRMLLIDRIADAVIAIDLTTGVRTLISGQGVGTGTALSQPLSIAYDGDNDRALVFDRSGARGVIAIDLATGDRSLFAGSFAGPEGHYMSDVRALAISGDELIGIDSIYDHAIALDLDTADRRIVTNNGFPRGDLPVSLNSLQRIDDRFYGHVHSAIGSIDTSNDFATLAGDLDGGANGLNVYDTVVTSDGSTAYSIGWVNVSNQWTNEIREIDLNSGVSTVLSDNSVPNANNPLQGSRDISLDEENNELIVLESQRIVRVNLNSGERTVIADDANMPYASPREVSVDSSNNRLLVVDTSYTHLIAVDMTSGVRTAFANTPLANEAHAERPHVFVQSDSGAMWLKDLSNRLLSVDPTSGARTMLVDIGALDDGYPKDWNSMTTSNGLLYVKDYSGILEVDPQSGEFLTVFATPAGSQGNET